MQNSVSDLSLIPKINVKMKTQYKNLAIILGIIGVIFILLALWWKTDMAYAYWKIDTNISISPAEAWSRGQPLLYFGGTLIVLAIFLFRGINWVRWLILLWCPLLMISLFFSRKPTTTEDEIIFSILMTMIWVVFVWKQLFKKHR